MDRGFVSVGSPQSVGATDEQASHDDLTRTASLEQDGDSHRIDLVNTREDSMNKALVYGFIDELNKVADDKPTFLDKGEDIVRMIGQHGSEGAAGGKSSAGKAWGAVKGGYRGIKASFNKHPKMFLGPAAAYAGYELLKAIKGKDEN